MTITKNTRIIRKPELFGRTGLSEATTWRMEKAGTFPQRISLGKNSVGWFAHEIDEWFEQKSSQRIPGKNPLKGFKR